MLLTTRLHDNRRNVAVEWLTLVRFQVLTAASMMFRAVFWVILPCKMMMEAVRTSETSVDNHFTRQYNPEESSEL
jgi:hypothetical protein